MCRTVCMPGRTPSAAAKSEFITKMCRMMMSAEFFRNPLYCVTYTVSVDSTYDRKFSSARAGASDGTGHNSHGCACDTTPRGAASSRGHSRRGGRLGRCLPCDFTTHVRSSAAPYTRVMPIP